MTNIKGQDIKDRNKGQERDGEMLVFKGEIENKVVFLNKKTIRIAAASTLIADVVKDKKELVSAIIKDTIALVSNPVLSEGISLDRLKSMISERLLSIESLLGLIHLGKLSGHFSVMNANVVSKEIRNLIGEYRSLFVSLTRDMPVTKLAFSEAMRFELPKNFFAVKTDSTPEPIVTESTFKSPEVSNIPSKAVPDTSANKESSKLLSSNNIQEKPIITVRSKQKNMQQERTVKIIGLLARSGEVSIKDITQELGDVSEKTIQRDLARMIKTGKVITEGKRRWTKYFLA